MGQLQFGYSEAIINPSLDITLQGYNHRFEQGTGNSGILDDLYARVLNLKLGDKELLLITLDLCLMSLETADSFREAISKKFKIPKEYIMLSNSHTHSGPATYIPKVENASESQNSKLEQEIQLYLETIKNRILTLCSQARCCNHPGKLTSTTLKMHLGYNRRYSKNNQGTPSVKMHFSLWNHPGEDINRAIDPDIPIIMIERLHDEHEDDYLEPSGQKKIVIFSVPYHPVVLGQDSRFVSADYPGAARACIEEALGSGTKAMFLLGACGDINAMLACQANPKPIQIVGRAIGYSVAAALSNRQEIEVKSLDAVEEEITQENPDKNRIVTQVFKIGEAAIAAVSAECFSELGIRVREASNFEQTLIASNSNGTVGYLPSKAAFPEGGYEVEIARNRGYSDDVLDRVIEKVIKILNKN